MSADITIRDDGSVEMFYYGATPWHQSGTKLDNPATAAEAIAAAQLDWEVVKAQISYHLPDGQLADLDDRYLIVRGDTGQAFNRQSMVTGMYQPVQNAEAFEFFDEIVGSGQAIYHTAGSLNGGDRVWILAKLPGDLVVGNNDLIEKYILLSNGHDGRTALTMRLTPIRVVCNNTLQAALRGRAQFEHRAIHGANLKEKIVAARLALGMGDSYFAMMMAGIERMVNTKMSAKQYDNFLFKIFGLDATKKINELHPLHQKTIAVMHELADSAPGNLEYKGTRWGAYNALTYYTDHVITPGRVKDVEDNTRDAIESRRLTSAWFGRNDALKAKAWDVLLPAEKLAAASR